ncbi:DNA invertase Pin-like site-specific DNA recombinase [Streptomyces sp. 846.5]|nr:recombinase family protein [Streptomyces sp. 846.5]TDU05626.1 DNA invertase Pin-like site-specific DNA recombinase [Streptomyces sp. 846.5]
MDQTGNDAGTKPQRAAGYVRISDDEAGEEKGVRRQSEDVTELAGRLGWSIHKIYPENDTSAYKRRLVRMIDGRRVWRVFRPAFRQMLQDYEDGVIDGIIVYDLDRLARQPRDLEDLIDLVDYFKRPVVGVTGSLDLLTENGKAMARVLVAMANKSSADTARRVARARLQSAQEGHSASGFRPFGWEVDRIVLRPAEADLVRRAALAFLDGETWSSLTNMIAGSGLPTVRGGVWRIRTVKNMILSPRIAGIAVYGGQMRTPKRTGGEVDRNSNPKTIALRDARGEYVRGAWESILTIEQWEAVTAEYERRRDGTDFTTQNTRKHLLSGLLRCGGLRSDGTTCQVPLVGNRTKNRAGTHVKIYKCPGKVHGGCGGTQRNMPKLDKLIEDLLFAHLTENAPDEGEQLPEVDGASPEAAELESVRSTLEKMRIGLRDGVIGPDSFFAVVPGLEQREKRLAAALREARQVRALRVQQSRSVDEVREDWDKATVPGRRAILAQYLRAVVVHPSQTRGPVFDHASIDPVWRTMPV